MLSYKYANGFTGADLIHNPMINERKYGLRVIFVWLKFKLLCFCALSVLQVKSSNIKHCPLCNCELSLILLLVCRWHLTKDWEGWHSSTLFLSRLQEKSSEESLLRKHDPKYKKKWIKYPYITVYGYSIQYMFQIELNHHIVLLIWYLQINIA